MDEKDQNLGFDLEDILKEFGEDPEEKGEAPATAQPPRAEDMSDTRPLPRIPEDTAPLPKVTGDTTVLPKVTEDTAVLPKVTGDTVVITRVKGDTIRMKPIKSAEESPLESEQTQRFEPVPETKGPEPYSKEWEPEY